MRKVTTIELIIFTILALHLVNPCLACNKVNKLGDVSKLELDQIFCVRGSGGCGFDVKQITCYNTGKVNIDGTIEWDCRTPSAITFPYRLGVTEVVCQSDSVRGYGQSPHTWFRGEPNCFIHYSVEYLGDALILGALLGFLWILVVYKLYLKGLSSSPSSSESRKVVKDIVFDDDHIWGRGPQINEDVNVQTGQSKVVVNLDNWTGSVIFDKSSWGEGLTQSYRRRRGPHSIGGENVGGNPWNGARTSGNLAGDMGIYRKIASKKEINEDDGNWPVEAGEFDHGTSKHYFGESTRTSSGTSVDDGAGFSSSQKYFYNL